jgi:hypothetical protein
VEGDISERQPVVVHECLVLGAEAAGNRTGSRFTPIIRVQIRGFVEDYSAMRYRTARHSNLHSSDEAQAWTENFRTNDSVACYSFMDGAVKMDQEVPDFAGDSYLFFALTGVMLVLTCATLVWLCTCVLRLIRTRVRAASSIQPSTEADKPIPVPPV